MPTKPGKLTLPAIRIPWWNTTTNKMEVAEIPAETYTIKAAPGSSVTVPQAPPQVPTTHAGANAQAPSQSHQVVTYVPSKLWIFVLVGAILLWAFSTWQWLATRRRLNDIASQMQPLEPPPKDHHISEADAWNMLAHACKAGDATRASKALFIWGTTRYPGIRTLEELGAKGNPQLQTEINILEDALYSPQGAGDWQGDRLLAAATGLRARKAGGEKKRDLADSLNPSLG